MIFFKEDWAKYPNAIADYKTKNLSAVIFAAKMKQMGIKNYDFMLALLNPRLQGVDPHDPHLTKEQMGWVAIECKTNPWYFFREVARAPSISGTNSKYVEFNRGNICLWWCFFNHITIILTQPRQTGKSFSTDLLMTLLLNFVCNNTQINLMTKDDKLRAENIKRLKDIYEELPAYLNLKTREDANNTEELSIKKLGNTYKTHVPQASKKRAYNLGRGMTTPIFHIDEGPFQVNIETALPAALASMGAAIDAAKAADEPYGIIYTTTAGKKDDADGKYFYGLIQESATWSERYYDAENAQEARRLVRQHSRSAHRANMPHAKDAFDGVEQVYACFSHRQLGKTDEWLYDQLKRTRAKGNDADRDFFNVWTSGTQSSPLDPAILEQMTSSYVDPDYESISQTGGYFLRWFVPEQQIPEFMRSRKVIMGIDPSDAGGGDDIGLVGVDCQTGGTVCAGNYNSLNLIVFAQWLVELLVANDNLTMIIEKRSSGQTLLDYLLLFLPQRGIDPYKRLFNWISDDPLAHPSLAEEANLAMARRTADNYTRAKTHFGFSTSGSGRTSRTALYSTTLQNAAKRFATRVHDLKLIQQISGLITKDGRIDHAPGEHDDLVIAWLLCHWFLTMAKNLNTYNIDSRKILIPVFSKAKSSPQDQMQERLQQLVRQRIETLIQLMKSEHDPVIGERHEVELRSLERQLILREGEVFSIDTVLTELHSNRSKRARANVQSHMANTVEERAGYRTQLDARYLPAGTIVL